MELSDRGGILLQVWWRWDGVEQIYRRMGLGDIVNPGIGFWVYALKEAELAPEP